MKLYRTHAIAALTVGLLVVIIGWRSVEFRRARAATLERAEGRAETLADILAAYLAGTFAAGDASLRQLSVHGARVGGVQAPREAWEPMLSQARAGLRGVGAMSVVDRTSTVRHSTRPELVGRTRPDDVVREALAGTGDALIVGQPVPGVVAPFGYLIPLARRLTEPDGRVEGAVVASFIVADLSGFLRTVNVGAQGRVWVFHRTGTRLVPGPGDAAAAGAGDGQVIVEASTRQRDGWLRGPASPDGPVLLTAYRSVPRLPLVVAVSLDEREVLAAWRQDVVNATLAYLAAACLLAVALWALFRQMRLAAAAEQSLADTRAQDAERLRATHEQLEAAFAREQRARSDAEAASALKDEFLMTVSHELRTPLNVVLNWALLLASGAVPEDRRAPALEAIARNARAQARLVDDLLDVSRGITGALRLDVAPVDVADVVRGAADTVALAADGKRIRLVLDVAEGIGRVSGDAARLQQVMWNLLANAVKFTPPGGEVRLRASRLDTQVVLSVQDTGTGISREFLPHVFDRFRQEHTGTTRPYGGLGLGLAIARHLVELHGGEIAAESDGPGRGARFTVRLPAAVPSREARALVAPHA